MHINMHVKKKYVARKEYFFQESKQPVVCF